MTTNAQLAATLLRNAADFFRTVGEQNPGVSKEMQTNAQTYDLIANLVENDPHAESPKARMNPGEGEDETPAGGSGPA